MKLDQPSKAVCNIVDDRDCRRCVVCGVSLYTVRGARHHRKMRSHAFGIEKHSPSNLVLLCEECHGMVHANPALAYKMGWLVHSYETAVNVPIYTWHGWMILKNDGSMVKADVENAGDTRTVGRSKAKVLEQS